MLRDLPPEARALAEYMSELSEQAYYAGWMNDLEFNLWAVLQRELHEYGRLKVSPAQLARLDELSASCGGWIAFHEDSEETFVSLEEWQSRYEHWRSEHQPG